MDKNGQKTIELRELNFEFQNDWRAGCNPPSVLDGIRLNGLPTPQADPSQASICPFTSQDSRFTASPQHSQRFDTHHSSCVGCDVSFLHWSQGSHPTLLQVLRCLLSGRSFLKRICVRKPSTSSPAKRNNCHANQ